MYIFAKTPMDHIFVTAEMAIALTAMDTSAMVNLPSRFLAITFVIVLLLLLLLLLLSWSCYYC